MQLLNEVHKYKFRFIRMPHRAAFWTIFSINSEYA